MDGNNLYELYFGGTNENPRPDVTDFRTAPHSIPGTLLDPYLFDAHQNQIVTQTPYFSVETQTSSSQNYIHPIPTNVTYSTPPTVFHDYQQIQSNYAHRVVQTWDGNDNPQHVPAHLEGSIDFPGIYSDQQVPDGYIDSEAHSTHYRTNPQFDTANLIDHNPSSGFSFSPQPQSTADILGSLNFGFHEASQLFYPTYPLYDTSALAAGFHNLPIESYLSHHTFDSKITGGQQVLNWQQSLTPQGDATLYSTPAISSSTALNENALCVSSGDIKIFEYPKNGSLAVGEADSDDTEPENVVEDPTTSILTQARRPCVRCCVMKKGCTGSKDYCKACNDTRYNCVTVEQVYSQLTSLDLYPGCDHITMKCLELPKTALSRQKANIFLQSGIDIQNCYLECEVDVSKLQPFDPAYLRLKMFGLREDMQSPSTETNFGWSQVLSCSLVPNSLRKEQGFKWVLESAPIKPSEAVGALQSALLRCARSYIKDAMRPLHKLVELALIHTSLYSIWHGRSYMVLDDKFDESFQVCPRLRVEIFNSLSSEIFLELRTTLVDAIKCFRQATDSEHLPLCLVLWMVLVTHLQCNLLAEYKKAAYFDDEYAELMILYMGVESLSPETEERVDEENIEGRIQREEEWFHKEEERVHEEKWKDSFNMIKTLHQALFKREKKIGVPVLNKELQVFCGKCPSYTKFGECLHNTELVGELVLLRLALQAQQVDMQQAHSQTEGSWFCSALDEIWGSDLLKAGFESLATLDIAMASPHSDETLLSETVNSDGVPLYQISLTPRSHFKPDRYHFPFVQEKGDKSDDQALGWIYFDPIEMNSELQIGLLDAQE